MKYEGRRRVLWCQWTVWCRIKKNKKKNAWNSCLTWYDILEDVVLCCKKYVKKDFALREYDVVTWLVILKRNQKKNIETRDYINWLFKRYRVHFRCLWAATILFWCILYVYMENILALVYMFHWMHVYSLKSQVCSRVVVFNRN